jgi:diguanylate cyclase (GGDEF)-like protein
LGTIIFEVLPGKKRSPKCGIVAETQMAKSDDGGSAFYKRLREQGTSDSEIEKVYRELRDRGYGEAAAQKRFEEAVRRMKAENQRKRGASGGRERREQPDTPERPPRPVSGGKVGRHPTETTGRRAEDWFPRAKPAFRRRVNRWSFRQRLLAVGFRERLEDLVSWIRSDVPDLINSRLVDVLADRKHYASYSPYEYTLLDTLDALHDTANVLLGTNQEDRSRITAALRRQDALGLEYLQAFADRQENLRVALTGIKHERDAKGRIEAARLGSVARELFRLVLRTEQLAPSRISHILATARDIGLAYGGAGKHDIDEALHLFRISIDNLQRFKKELSPIIVRGLGTLLSFDPENDEERSRIFSFLQLRADEILTPEGFAERQSRARERDLLDRQRHDLEAFERAKEEGLTQQFAGTFAVLRALFPDSGLDRMDSLPYYLPYFDTRVFSNSLVFPHDTANIEVVSRRDPLQPVFVLHRIIDSMLSSVDFYQLEKILIRDGIGDAFASVKRRWSEAYLRVFQPYLRALTTFYHGVSDDGEYQQHFRQSTVARSLSEEVTRLRNVCIAGYGHALLPPQTEIPRIYEATADLSELLHLVGEDLNDELLRRNDAVGKRIYRSLSSEPIIDFETHGGKDSPELKPVTRQVRRYLEARHYSSINTMPSLAQIFFFQVLRGIVDLYLYLLTDENSFLRGAGANIRVAEEEERHAWEEAESSDGRESLETLQEKLRKEMEGDLRDELTGLWNKNYFLKALPEELENLEGAGKTYTLVLLDIDHFKWVNDTLGHRFGDDVLRKAAEAILDGIRTANDRAIRYGGEEILLILQAPLHQSILTAERLRFAQEGSIQTDDFYAQVRAISEEKGEPVATFSIGIVAGGTEQTMSALVDAADKALYQAKKNRNALCVSRNRESGDREVVDYATYVEEIRDQEA